MNISKEQAIKDLELETLSTEAQESIIGSFFRGLEAKIKLALLDGMTPEQQQEFSGLEGEKQDEYMEKLVGGDMDAFVDDLYQEHVDDFKSGSEALARGLSSK